MSALHFSPASRSMSSPSAISMMELSEGVSYLRCVFRSTPYFSPSFIFVDAWRSFTSESHVMSSLFWMQNQMLSEWPDEHLLTPQFLCFPSFCEGASNPRVNSPRAPSSGGGPLHPGVPLAFTTNYELELKEWDPSPRLLELAYHLLRLAIDNASAGAGFGYMKRAKPKVDGERGDRDAEAAIARMAGALGVELLNLDIKHNLYRNPWVQQGLRKYGVPSSLMPGGQYTLLRMLAASGNLMAILPRLQTLAVAGGCDGTLPEPLPAGFLASAPVGSSSDVSQLGIGSVLLARTLQCHASKSHWDDAWPLLLIDEDQLVPLHKNLRRRATAQGWPAPARCTRCRSRASAAGGRRRPRACRARRRSASPRPPPRRPRRGRSSSRRRVSHHCAGAAHGGSRVQPGAHGGSRVQPGGAVARLGRSARRCTRPQSVPCAHCDRGRAAGAARDAERRVGAAHAALRRVARRASDGHTAAADVHVPHGGGGGGRAGGAGMRAQCAYFSQSLSPLETLLSPEPQTWAVRC